MKNYGLIGYPLGHSFSESFFREKFDREGIVDSLYRSYPLKSLEELPELLQNVPSLMGLNVTIPYKREIIPFLNSIDKDAEEAGAVNVIKITQHEGNTVLKGYNTDIYGFMTSLLSHIPHDIRSALVLGTGGSSAAVAYVLNRLNISYAYVSRQKKADTLLYEELNDEIVTSSRLIINTTPVGMFPDTEQKPAIPYHFLTRHHILFDLIYNPEETSFLKEGKGAGCMTVNGLEMLMLQAERSWEIWNDPAY